MSNEDEALVEGKNMELQITLKVGHESFSKDSIEVFSVGAPGDSICKEHLKELVDFDRLKELLEVGNDIVDGDTYTYKKAITSLLAGCVEEIKSWDWEDNK